MILIPFGDAYKPYNFNKIDISCVIFSTFSNVQSLISEVLTTQTRTYET